MKEHDTPKSVPSPKHLLFPLFFHLPDDIINYFTTPRLRMGAEFALASSSQKLLLCADFCGMTFKQLSLGLSPRTQTLSKCVCVSLCERVWLFLFFSLTTKVCRDISRRAQAFGYFACHKTCCFALLFLPRFLS